MAQAIRPLIAASVNSVLRQLYPDSYSSLCHAHAIVGANLISVVTDRVYRPVAGLAVIDCGGDFIYLTDNEAFANPAGGAFHCWIESADPAIPDTEIVDMTFRHNHEYAVKNGKQWNAPHPPDYLWGPRSEIVVQAALDDLPPSFDGKVWLHETDEGWSFMTRHLAEHMNASVVLTAKALQELQSRLPAGSTALAALTTPREAARASATDSVPASSPVAVD